MGAGLQVIFIQRTEGQGGAGLLTQPEASELEGSWERRPHGPVFGRVGHG